MKNKGAMANENEGNKSGSSGNYFLDVMFRRSEMIRFQTPLPPLINSVTLGKLLKLSVPQFLFL